ncbi:WecB/TagA/CpsF family glycosyltransferase [Bradyrhizobium sp. WSM1417]|uniref:WecB/TagA/CpsF family glycosyltransferase n=1 Tax=Bradyrhizobium sp. WSM1417 TaxID=754500 RepID=UPI0018DE1EB2|nr:WecB/TagA/CpsF family glycosyltransferase [Bradyrhizobium sp. WSM1417]
MSGKRGIDLVSKAFDWLAFFNCSREIKLKLPSAVCFSSQRPLQKIVESKILGAGEKINEVARQVYGLLGLPVDAIDFRTLMETMDAAVAQREAFLISTPNVNFLLKSHRNAAFRASILHSDLCLVDGMPLIWIAKLLRVPIRERLAGSDLFGRLKARADRPLRVFLFGGTGDLAVRVGVKLNLEKSGLECVGALNPGFGTVDDLSSSEIIETINRSGADLLAVFLNAEKAQAWLLHNHARLTVPVRAQFGATINFEAGTVKRAPQLLRSTGFEWLWRIKEEPYLWRRYWSDGCSLLGLLLFSVLPLAVDAALNRPRDNLSVQFRDGGDHVTISPIGSAAGADVERIVPLIDRGLVAGKPIKFDLSRTSHIDGRFFGVLLALSRELAKMGQSLDVSGVPPRLERLFRLNRFEFLLASD